MFCLANCCRLCLTNNSSVVEYTFCSSNEVSYFQKLMDIVPALVVETESYYPTGICKNCQIQLDQAHTFIQQCFKSKKILHSYITKLNQSINKNITISPIEINNSVIGNKSIKIEIDIDDSIVVPETTSDGIDLSSQNPFLDKTNSVSIETFIKEEVPTSEFLTDQDQYRSELLFTGIKNEHHSVTPEETSSNWYENDNQFNIEEDNLDSELLFTNVKNEHHNVTMDETNSNWSEKDDHFDIEQDNLNSDASISPDEYEPLRKNEKTPRLKRYSCLKCAKKFSRYSHLLRHSRVHTGNRPYPCTNCNKSFSQLENLERHQLIHSDIKPYTCTECGKSFRDKSYFKKHVELHKGIRYTCDICGKAYTNSKNLIVHNRKHTGERPFECSLCKNKYADPDTLRKHKKKCESKMSSSDVQCSEQLVKLADVTEQVAN